MTPDARYKTLLGAAGMLAVVSCVWFGGQEFRMAGARRTAAPGAVVLSATPYAGAGRDIPEAPAKKWEAPATQRRGQDWVYEVFAAPEIFYDERTRQFRIAAPSPDPVPAVPAASPSPAPFGLALVNVKRTPFRLQLVGYVGGEETYRGLFENVPTSETFLATGGRRVPALELTIEDFQVRRQPVPLNDSTTTRRRIATAVVRDDRTGEAVALNDRERCYAPAPVATVATPDGAALREVSEGDQLQVGGDVFRIGKIQLAPPAVEIGRVVADELTDRRVLTVPANAPAAPTPPEA